MWLLRLKGLVGASVSRYALIGLASLAITALGYSHLKAYDFGWERRDAKAQKELASQALAIAKQKDKERELIIKSITERLKAHDRVSKVDAPTCDISPECLQYHDNIIRAATGTD